MDLFNPKSRGIHGHTVILIIFGLLIAENEVVLGTLSIIEDLQVNTSFKTYGITNIRMSEYFTEEKNVVFRKLERIYKIGALSSTSNPSTSGKRDQQRQQRKEKILVLTYSTLLALWTAIDFRICGFIFSMFDDRYNEGYEIQKQWCLSYSREMHITFLDFRKRLEKIVKQEKVGEPPVLNKKETEAVQWVLVLSSDFILDENSLNTLCEKELPEQEKEFFSWWETVNVENNGNFTKQNSFFTHSAKKYRQREDKTIQGMYDELQQLVRVHMGYHLLNPAYPVLVEQVVQDFVENDYYFFIFFWDIHYPIKFQMWKMLMAEFPEDEFPKNIEMDEIDRIKKAIEIMEKIRLMHLTIMIKSLKYDP